MDNDDTLLAECARALESLWVSSRGWTHEDRAREILRIIRPRIEAERDRLRTDRDEWKDSTISANRRFEHAEAGRDAAVARAERLREACQILKSRVHRAPRGHWSILFDVGMDEAVQLVDQILRDDLGIDDGHVEPSAR
jgi:hypothetical protein